MRPAAIYKSWIVKGPVLSNRETVVLLHDNARLNPARITQEKISKLGWFVPASL